MALLDVSEVLDDPLFNNPVVVKRQQQTIGTDGRVVLVPTTLNISAVVTQGASDAVQRAADFEAGKQTITLHTRTALIGPSNGLTDYQPDEVQWNGNQYLVRKVSDWSNFGSGYTAVEAEMINTGTLSPGGA